ncbi:MAG TPA: GNAT family N-acetyltransferase [Alphaproteobacteria bacterium]|nr:GNAT family N-acetyltransferase [Alphaproteobacteria bacterium]
MARAALFERVARGNFDSFVALVRAQHTELKSRFGVAQRRALRMLMRGDAFGHGWLIKVNAVPAGFVIVSLGYSVEYGGRDAFIDELYVLPEFRRRGLGSRAVQFAERFCRGRGVTTVHLEVARGNRAAKAIYRRAGFKAHGLVLMSKAVR